MFEKDGLKPRTNATLARKKSFSMRFRFVASISPLSRIRS